MLIEVREIEASEVIRDLNNVLKNDYKTTEEWLLFYEERKKDYYENVKYIDDRSPRHDLSRLGAGHSSWTEYKIVQLGNLEHEEKWLLTVELIESILDTEGKMLLKIRRQAARKSRQLQEKGEKKLNWITYVQQKYALCMANDNIRNKDKYFLSERTIIARWKKIVRITQMIAMKRKCVF